MLSFDEKIVEINAENVDFREEIYSITSAEVISNKGNFSLIVHSETDFDDVTIRPFYLKTSAKPFISVRKRWQKQRRKIIVQEK